MSDKCEKMSLFEQLKSGLKDSVAYSRGELTLETTELPAPRPQVRAGQVRAIRRRLRMSQAVFAATVNVSARTILSWEQGARRPSDAALRVLQIIHDQPQIVEQFFHGPAKVAANIHPLNARSNARYSSARASAKSGNAGKCVRHRSSGAKIKAG